MTEGHGRFITCALVLLAAVTTGCSWEPPREQRADPQRSLRRSLPAPASATAPAAAEAPSVAPAPVPVVDLEPASFAGGEEAFYARDYAAAASIFARYVGDHPTNAWGHFMLGLSAWKNGDLDRAERAFDEALRIDPRHVKSLVNWSRVMLDRHRPDEAIEKLAQAGEIDPTSGEVHRLVGRAASARGDTAGAVDAYRRAIAIDAQDGWALNNLGLLFFEQGRAADALPLFARAVEIRQDVPAFQNNLGMALEHTGHVAAAAEAYGRALVADPAYEKAERNLARVEQIKSDPREPFDLAAAALRVAEILSAGEDEPDVAP